MEEAKIEDKRGSLAEELHRVCTENKIKGWQAQGGMIGEEAAASYEVRWSGDILTYTGADRPNEGRLCRPKSDEHSESVP